MIFGVFFWLYTLVEWVRGENLGVFEGFFHTLMCHACCHRDAPKICLLLDMQLLTPSQYPVQYNEKAEFDKKSAAHIVANLAINLLMFLEFLMQR